MAITCWFLSLYHHQMFARKGIPLSPTPQDHGVNTSNQHLVVLLGLETNIWGPYKIQEPTFSAFTTFRKQIVVVMDGFSKQSLFAIQGLGTNIVVVIEAWEPTFVGHRRFRKQPLFAIQGLRNNMWW